jgi:hypothetical protein
MVKEGVLTRALSFSRNLHTFLWNKIYLEVFKMAGETIVKNRIDSVVSRYEELMELLKSVDCNQDTFDQIVTYVTQSHSNEIRLIALISKDVNVDLTDVQDCLK